MLKPYKVKAILSRWVEHEALSRGMSSIEVLGVSVGSSPEELSDSAANRLTVACKVEACPRICGVLGHKFSSPRPAVEIAARYRMDLEALEARKPRTPELDRAANRAAAFLACVEATKEYKAGMRQLAKTLEAASLVDGDRNFLAYVCAAIMAAGGGAEQLRLYMRQTDWTAQDVADLLGVRRDTVLRWMNGSEPIPEARLNEVERHINDLRDCLLLFERLKEIKRNPIKAMGNKNTLGCMLVEA